MTLFATELDILLVTKVASHIFFLIISRKSTLILMIFLPIERRLTLHNVIIHIKSVVDKNKNRYYYKIFLEKC